MAPHEVDVVFTLEPVESEAEVFIIKTLLSKEEK